MNVMIIEIDSGKVVAIVPVILRGLNYHPSEQEYFSAAWESVVEDGAVDSKSRADYTFRLLP